jgi:regulator of replication initiation timing
MMATRLYEEVIRLHEEVIRLHEEVIRLQEEVIRLHEEVIRLHEEVIRLHEEVIRLQEVVARRGRERQWHNEVEAEALKPHELPLNSNNNKSNIWYHPKPAHSANRQRLINCHTH